MPVIQLPRDDRWGQLGQGLGNLLGTAISAYKEKEASEGVAQLLSDPTIAEDKRHTEAIKRYGPIGSKVYKEAIAAQVLESLVQQRKAEMQKDLAAVGIQKRREDLFSQLMGVPVSGIASGGSPAGAATSTTAIQTPMTTAAPTPTTAAQSSGVGNVLSRMIDQHAAAGNVMITPEEKQTLYTQSALAILNNKDPADPIKSFIAEKQKGAKFPSELSASQSGAATAAAGAAAAPAVAAGAAAAAPTVAPKARADLTKAERDVAATTPTTTTPGVVGDVYSTFTPEQNAAVAQAAQTGGAKAAGELIDKFVTANTAAARSGSDKMIEQVSDIEKKVVTFNRVMDDIETNPRSNGGIEPVVHSFLARWGYDFGRIPPAEYGEFATVSQLALQALQGHRGFGGAYLVKSVAETMPTAAKQKIFKAIETHYQAEQSVTELESLRRAAVDKGQNTGQLDFALESARKLKERTGTLWWTADRRVFYNGKEINPDTWIPIEGGAREFASKDFLRLREGLDMRGAQVNKLAREAGITPEEMLAKLRAQQGAAPVAR